MNLEPNKYYLLPYGADIREKNNKNDYGFDVSYKTMYSDSIVYVTNVEIVNEAFTRITFNVQTISDTEPHIFMNDPTYVGNITTILFFDDKTQLIPDEMKFDSKFISPYSKNKGNTKCYPIDAIKFMFIDISKPETLEKFRIYYERSVRLKKSYNDAKFQLNQDYKGFLGVSKIDIPEDKRYTDSIENYLSLDYSPF